MINESRFLGRLQHNLRIKKTAKGAVLNFSIVVDGVIDGRKNLTLINLVAFNSTASDIFKALKKSQQIYVETYYSSRIKMVNNEKTYQHNFVVKSWKLHGFGKVDTDDI